MTVFSIITSVISGLLLGNLYGHFFCLRQRNGLFISPKKDGQNPIKITISTFKRTAFLILCLVLLLRSGTIHLILVVPLLMVTFFFTVYRFTQTIK